MSILLILISSEILAVITEGVVSLLQRVWSHHGDRTVFDIQPVSDTDFIT